MLSIEPPPQDSPRPDNKQLLSSLENALNEDDRVLPFHAPEASKDWDRFILYYLARPRPRDEELLAAEGWKFAVRFAHPLEFTIRAQRKNQPIFRTYEDIPSEEYLVVWDGYSLMTFWQQGADDDVTPAGGHIVKDVIRRAAESIGAGIYFQGCRPECDYEFGHTDLLIEESDDIEEPQFAPGSGPHGVVRISMPLGAPKVSDLALSTYFRAWLPLGYFGEMKNVAQRLALMSELVSTDLPGLLGLLYHLGEVHDLPPRKRLGEWWSHRGWRGEMRRMMDRLWLGIAHVGQLRNMWSQRRFEFERVAHETGGVALFEGDHIHDVQALQEIDLDLVQAAVNQVSGRLEMRALVRATALAALSAIAGAAIGIAIAS